MAYNPDDFAQGAGILTEANDYMDAAVKILRRDVGQRVAGLSISRRCSGPAQRHWLCFQVGRGDGR